MSKVALFAREKCKKRNVFTPAGLLIHCAKAGQIFQWVQEREKIRQTPNAEHTSPLSAEGIRYNLQTRASQYRNRAAEFGPAVLAFAHQIDELAAEADSFADKPEELECKLKLIEGEIVAVLRELVPMAPLRAGIERDIQSFRGKMSAEQFTNLHDSYVRNRLFESKGLPRLTVFDFVAPDVDGRSVAA